MPRMTDTMLDGGDPFPPLELNQVGGGKVRLPEDLAGGWGVVLLYRGHWWPYCKQQLTAFSRASRLKEEGIKVVAVSVDTEQDAKKTIAECGIDFPVGYGAACQAVARLTGCFYEERRQILHSTGYVLRPDGTIAVAVYSTSPVGRLVWQDVLSLVQGYKQRGQR